MTTASTTRPTSSVSLRAVTTVLAVLFAFPALFLVWRNIASGSDPLALLGTRAVLGPLQRTIQLAVLVSISAGFMGTALAWLTTRTDLPFARFWRTVLPIPLVFPTFIGAAAFIRTLNPGGLANDLLENVGVVRTFQLDGLLGAWLVLTLFTYPYVYLPVAARLRRLPGSIEESARVLGDSPRTTFRRIVLPQITASIAAGTLLVFLYTISDFGAVQLMSYDTLTRAIESNYLAKETTAVALSLILLLLAALVVVGERMLNRRMPARSVSRSVRPAIYSLGSWRMPAFLSVVVVAMVGIGAPMVAILDWAAAGVQRSRNGQTLTIDTDDIVSASWHTLEASSLAAVAAVAAVLPIAFLVGRYRDPLGSASHAVVIATFALPGILIALALRYWALSAGDFGDFFYDTKALLIFAYVVRFGSLAMGITLVAVQAVPDRFHDAAATLGASRLRRLTSIDLPLMAPGLLAATGLVLLSTMKELPITLLMAPLGYRTLTTRIFGSFEEAFVAEAGIMAVILVAMSGILSWFLVLRGAEHR